MIKFNEEPGAGKLHAGIYRGSAPKGADLPNQKYDEQDNSSHFRKSIFDRRNRSIIEKELQLQDP